MSDRSQIARHGDADRLPIALHEMHLASVADEPLPVGKLCETRQRHILPDGLLQKASIALAMFGQKRDAAMDRLRRRARNLDSILLQPQSSGAAVLGAEQDSGEIGPPGAHQAGETENLSRADIHADVGQHSGTSACTRLGTDALNTECLIAWSFVAAVPEKLHVSTDHQSHQILGRVIADPPLTNQATVAKHG